jgi:lipoprotein-releasing system permease protein
MNWTFFRYFYSYIFQSKTRQRLLFIAVVGLFLSTFALMVIQGIMGGLQRGLVARSKNIHGVGVLRLQSYDEVELEKFLHTLQKQKTLFTVEYELEVMLKSNQYMAPAKIHGIDLNYPIPEFLNDRDINELVLGSDLAGKLKTQFGEEVQIISPAHTDSLLGDIPRFVTVPVSDYMFSELPEVDSFEAWVRLPVIQNLVRERGINLVRFFRPVLNRELKAWRDEYPNLKFQFESWEKQNSSLVMALNLETKVMLFLFVSMALLVAVAITSGLLIFYSKVKTDLMSFWILGLSESKLLKLVYRFTLSLSAMTCLMGLVSGIFTLKILEHYGHRLMPDIFIERHLPVDLHFINISLSFLIPFAISWIFSFFSFQQFKKEHNSFIGIIRSVN